MYTEYTVSHIKERDHLHMLYVFVYVACADKLENQFLPAMFLEWCLCFLLACVFGEEQSSSLCFIGGLEENKLKVPAVPCREQVISPHLAHVARLLFWGPLLVGL